MKRHLFSSAAGTLLLLVASTFAAAKGCKGVDTGAGMDCREIDKGVLGGSYYLAPEDFEIRGIKSPTSVVDNPWATVQKGKTYQIDLKKESPGGGAPVPTTCGTRSISFQDVKLQITTTDGKSYQVTLTAPISASLTMTPKGTPDQDVWLEGAPTSDKDMHYFIFLRDKFKPVKDNLPKYLYVEALDFSVAECKAKAPVMGAGGTVRVKKKAPQVGGPAESGVGGGGEGNH